MNLFVRWLRFNVVGAMGMGVQLGALALLGRCDGGHYLLASAAVVELAVLHNFVWHLRVTWPDRRAGSAVLGQLTRFHLSNGMVSLLGNLGLMRLLVGNAHLPVLAANGIAVLCCSVVNFCLGHTWAFAGRPREVECRP
ncbi:MAG: GtrA family protein [Terracidiphilus sp.]